MQDHPPAPGRARQRHPGTDGPAACGGAAGSSSQAWDHVRSRAVPLHLPLALAHVRAGAASLPLALAHVRAGAASLLLAPAHVRAGAASLLLAPPGQPGPASADRSVLRSTDLSPAYLRRRLQAVLRRIAATPRHPDYSPAHPLNRHFHASMSHTPLRGVNPRPPVATGGPPGGYAPPTRRFHCVTYAGHPAIQGSSRPPPATAGTGGSRQHPSRAPPPPAQRKPTLFRGPSPAPRPVLTSPRRNGGP